MGLGRPARWRAITTAGRRGGLDRARVSRRASLLVLAADVVGLLAALPLAAHGAPWVVLMAGLTLVTLGAGRYYRPLLHLSVIEELPGLLQRLALATAVTAAVLVVGRRDGDLSAFLPLAVVTACGQLLARAAAYRVVRVLRSAGFVAHAAVVYGAGVAGAQLAGTLRDHPEYGLRLVGYLDDDPVSLLEHDPLRRLGGVADLERVVAEHGVAVVIVAFSHTADARLVPQIRSLHRYGCELFIVPRLWEVVRSASSADHIGAVPVTRVPGSQRRGLMWALKRTFDVVASGAALAALSPLMLVIAALVRREGGPGVLFRQVRVGRDGREFEVLKFRSLKPVDESESATHWNISHDARLGPVGKVLRRTSLDELPQLINILRGDMSVVGPRPERPHFVDQFGRLDPRYTYRHRVPCGLTGLAQVNGLRGDTSIADRVRYDNYYIENWSIWLDIKIILMTVREVVGARGG